MYPLFTRAAASDSEKGQPSAAATGNEMTTVAIIGTAGRKEDAAKMNKQVFERMVEYAADKIQRDWKLPNNRVTLVSGGAAWTDHVAVRLFIREIINPDGQPYAGLKLFLPCAMRDNRFVDNGSSGWTSNPGRVANFHHVAFSRAMGYQTLQDIGTACAFGAVLDVSTPGFHSRNRAVAQCADRVLAFTWGADTSQPKDGGTLHTWNLCTRAVRVHVPLVQLMALKISAKRGSDQVQDTPKRQRCDSPQPAAAAAAAAVDPH